MMSNRLRLVIAAMTVVLLLTPALIWSDKRPSRNAVNDVSLKLPPVSTIGPEEQPYLPTQLERDKLLLHTSYSSPAQNTQGLPRFDTPPKNAAYSGMTPAEFEKLTRTRETVAKKTTVPKQSQDSISTIDNIPRAPGIEGLTNQERTKLEEHLKNQH